MCSILLGANPKVPLILGGSNLMPPAQVCTHLGCMCESSLNCQLSLNLASEEATWPVIAKLAF